MSALGQALISMCVAAGSSYQEACSKALDAGSKQSGVETIANETEQKVIKIGTEKAFSIFTKDGALSIGAVAFAANAVKTGSVQLQLPTMDICQEAATEISGNAVTLKMKWTLP